MAKRKSVLSLSQLLRAANVPQKQFLDAVFLEIRKRYQSKRVRVLWVKVTEDLHTMIQAEARLGAVETTTFIREILTAYRKAQDEGTAVYYGGCLFAPNDWTAGVAGKKKT